MNISKRNFDLKSIFLAGSIENGKAIDWQSDIASFIGTSANIFNPRRSDWDSTWVQSFENPSFFQQVNWELDALEISDLIIMYFDPKTLSPISLMELGIFAKSGKLHVSCPDGFWRKGNIEVVCNKYNIPLYDNLTDLKQNLIKLGYGQQS